MQVVIGQPFGYIWRCAAGHTTAVSEVQMVESLVEPRCRVCGGQLDHPVRPLYTGPVAAALLNAGEDDCPRCDGYRYVEDPTACGDEDHCSPWAPCPDCWHLPESVEVSEG